MRQFRKRSLKKQIGSLTNKNSNSFKKHGKIIEKYSSYSEELIERDQQYPSIFVSIASYRDKYCRLTLADLFQKAKFPGRIFAGICEQNTVEDVDCLKTHTAAMFKDNIRVVRIDASEAKGPMYARAIIEEELYNNELFYMVIDSHTMFEVDWDEKAISQLLACSSSQPVITCYPNDWDGTSFIPPQNRPATFLRLSTFNPKTGLPLQISSPYKGGGQPQEPQPSLLWAAGFSFTLGRVISEVPYDKNYPYLFTGEEISTALRLFTHGWDLFNPSINIVYHIPDRSYRPTFWEQFHKRGVTDGVITNDIREYRKTIEAQSVRKVVNLMGGKDVHDVYQIGKKRTLKDFENYTGIYFSRRQAKRRAYLGVTENASESEKTFKKGVKPMSMLRTNVKSKNNSRMLRI